MTELPGAPQTVPSSSNGSRSDRRISADDPEIMLGLLSAIEQNSKVTQRSLSRDLGIALGLANAYLKRCARKGYVKIQEIPLNRYAYYLTPKGFSEKARLTTEYLSVSLNFFRRARQECAELFDRCSRQGWTRVALCGASDLAEIATLCARDGCEIVAIVDSGRAGTSFAHLPVVDSLEAAGPVDAVIVTDLTHPQATYDALASALSRERVLAPALLRIVEEAAPGPGEDIHTA